MAHLPSVSALVAIMFITLQASLVHALHAPHPLAHSGGRQLLQGPSKCPYGGRDYAQGQKRVGPWGPCDKCNLVCCSGAWEKGAYGGPIVAPITMAQRPTCEPPAGMPQSGTWKTGQSRPGDGKTGSSLFCCYGRWEPHPCIAFG